MRAELLGLALMLAAVAGLVGLVLLVWSTP